MPATATGLWAPLPFGQGLLLGPLAVDPGQQGRGLGAQLMRVVLARAAERGHGAILLVGDAPYYARFGFSSALTGGLALPGPVERSRFLGLELRAGALDGTLGLVTASGRLAPLQPTLPPSVPPSVPSSVPAAVPVLPPLLAAA